MRSPNFDDLEQARAKATRALGQYERHADLEQPKVPVWNGWTTDELWNYWQDLEASARSLAIWLRQEDQN